MNDNIIIKKMWQDSEVIQLKVTCFSSVAAAVSKIYVSDYLIDELINQIGRFLNGNIEEGLWANEETGNDSTACVALRFIKKDKLGHIIIEVFAELDDGGNYAKHNCCFFVSTEYGLLMNFCENLIKLKDCLEGYEIKLNP
ncbi:MAG: hypothetical protein J6B37_04875 [Clostridia bacterium]|nr:hypothetical protein [Clostridia bacterium]